MWIASWESHWPSYVYTQIKIRLYMKSNIAVGERLLSVTTGFVHSRRRSNIIHNCLQRKWMTWKLHKYGRHVGVTKKQATTSICRDTAASSYTLWFNIIGTTEPVRQILTYKPRKRKIIFIQVSSQSYSRIRANIELRLQILKRNFTNSFTQKLSYNKNIIPHFTRCH